MRKILLLLIVITSSFSAISQDFSNKGKDFWVGYGYHQVMTGANSQDMVLYFATDQVTNITITIPGIGYTQNLTSGAGNNVLTSVIIPKQAPQDARLNTEGLSNKGIHITSDKNMVAYAHIYNASVSGATILYPTNTLGKEYYSINFRNVSNTNNANPFFYVVATDTGTTTVEITPSGNTIGGWTAGNTYTVTLTQGQIYNVMGILTSGSNPFTAVDLTGSRVKSVSTGTGCKRIGVFSGSGRISITCNNGSSSSDNYMVQSVPKTAWGKKYLTVPAVSGNSFNYFRICVTDPATVVRINGVVTGLPLNGGFYYEQAATNQPLLIEGNLPIMVAQYFTSQGACGNPNQGDPEVIYLSAVEQNINTVLWNATPNFGIANHAYNVVLPSGGTAVSSFTLDGAPVSGWQPHPQDPAYVYLQQYVSSGPHVIKSDSGFNAIAYGFGNAESYGYNAGTNIKDLYQQIRVNSPNGIEQTPSVCTNSPFQFKVSLPYCADSIAWDLSGLPGPPVPAFDTLRYSTCTVGPGGPDSITVINGKNVYWYSLPTTYSFNTIGAFPVTITVFAPDPEGCGSVQFIDFDLTVSDPPTGSFSFTTSGCVADTVRFTETTPQLPKATYRWYWNFGDPASGANNTSTLKNPLHLFSAPGTYTVKYAAITTPGCLIDTVSNTVTILPLPSATITGNNTVCINDPAPPPIIFTATGGTAPYTFIYNINGGPSLTLNTVTGNTASIIPPTGVAGTFVYTLDSVKNTGSTLCTQDITGQQVTFIVNPDASINLTSAAGTDNQTICEDLPIVDIRYTIAGGGTNATATGLPIGVTGTFNAGVFTITGTPTTAGTYNYTVNTTGTCLQTSATGTITVNPDASIALTSAPSSDNQSVCESIAITNITYNITGGGTGATVTGLPAGITGNYAGGVFTINGSSTVVGTYNYTVTTSGSCLQTTATGTITINPDATISLSSAVGTDNQAICESVALTDITYNITGGGTGAGVAGLPTGVNGVYTAGVFTISGTPTVPGTYNYTVTTTGTCLQKTATGTITVNPDASIALTSAPSTDNQTVCESIAITNITYNITGGGTGATVAGLPAGITGNYAGAVFTINGSSAAVGTFNYTVTTTGTCVQTTATGTITINPDATISLSSAAGTDNQTLCENVAITAITYDITGGGTGAGVSGLPAGVNGVYAAGVFTITGTPTIPGTYNYTVTTTGTCVQKTATGTITVNPDASITLTSAPSTTSQELCVNASLVDITYAIAGGGTGAGVTGLPAGVTGSFAGGVFTITGTPTASGVFNYTVTTTGNCAQNAEVGTITVNALPTADFIFTTPNCETKTIRFTDASTPNSGSLSTWQWDFGDGSPLGSGSPIDHAYLLAGTYNVTLVVTTDKGCESDPDMTKQVTVSVNPKAGFIIPEVCLNDVDAVFTDTSSITTGSIVGWLWDFGDPASGPLNTSTAQNGVHKYTATGTYQVKLIVYSNTGCPDTLTQPITINGSTPIADYAVNNPAGLCANDSVRITNLSTVNPGVITKVEIYWDFLNQPAVFELDNVPFPNKVYPHLYPNFQAPLTKNFTVRFRAYSGTLCVDDEIKIITVNAAPSVQFNNMPNSCLLIPPFQITQASETGGVPGSAVYSGPGVSPTGLFSPQVAGVGTHTILYTYTSSAGGCVDTMSNTITVLDTASARFTYVSPICETTAASFTDVSTPPAGVTIANTVWDFGDGSPIENHVPGSTFTHTFTGSGTFTVTMYNVSSVGCNSTVYTEQVTVDPNHNISMLSANGTDIQTVCINQPIINIQYTLGGGATGATVSGLPAGVNAAVTGTTLTISGTPTSATGSPFVFNVVTTGNTCTIADTTGSITVQPDHSISLTSSPNSNAQVVCVNSTINNITYSIGGGATNAVVSGLPVGVTYSVTGNTLTITGTPTSTAGGPNFPYSITTSGNNCVQASATGSISVNPFPRPDFTVDKTSYCLPNALVQFTNASSISDNSSMTYNWNFGEPSSGAANVSSSLNPSHTYSGIGPFSVKLTATSSVLLSNGVTGCSHDTTIVINTIHPQPKADFSISRPGVCIGDQVTFTDISDYKDGTPQTRNWDLGDGTLRNTATVTHLYGDTLTYQVKLYVVNSFGCNSDTITKPFTVFAYPTVNAGPDRFILEGGSIVLDPIVTGKGLQYLWTPNQYMPNNTLRRPTVFKPLSDMTYTLKVTTVGGCSDSDQVFVKLLKFPKIPNTFTPNNDGINDKWLIDYLNTYPDNRVQVFTRSGQLVFESRGYNTPWDGTMKGKTLPFDTYYYIIEPGNGRLPITGYITIIK